MTVDTLAQKSPTGRGRLTIKKKLLFVFLTGAVVFLAAEIGTRVIFAFRVGPSALLYGIESAHQRVELEHPDPDQIGQFYNKFRPHQVRYDFDQSTQRRFRVTINSGGFRGVEISTHKPPGVLRVVTLGASSTFGYYSRDHQTYPRQMQDILNRECGRPETFQVINLGIPHLTSSEIAALFHAEALPLEPDVVTYYEGINDCYDKVVSKSAGPRRRTKLTLRTAFHAVRNRLLFVAFADDVLRPPRSEYRTVEMDNFEGRVEPYLANIERIRQECLKRGILFVVATQQARSLLVERRDIKGMTYAQEVELVQKTLKETGKLDRRAAHFLTHAQLMAGLRQWAEQNGVPLVDVIKALDQDRDVILSWVHVSPRGNQMIARQFADAIMQQMCQQKKAAAVSN